MSQGLTWKYVDTRARKGRLDRTVRGSAQTGGRRSRLTDGGSLRGVATLELVLCMPIILALTVAIVWLGFSVVGQSQVAVEARHKAWKQRFDGESGKALYFLRDDFVTEDATKEVTVSPLVDGVSPPESSHDIAVGVWDYQNLEMNSAPNWGHYVTAAANAKTGGLQVAYTDARNQLAELQNIAADALLEQLQNTIREFLDNPLADLENLGGGQREEANEKAEREKGRLDREIRSKGAEIDRVKDKIKELKDENAEKARIKVHRNKQKRLEAELKMLRDDRESLD